MAGRGSKVADISPTSFEHVLATHRGGGDRLLLRGSRSCLPVHLLLADVAGAPPLWHLVYAGLWMATPEGLSGMAI